MPPAEDRTVLMRGDGEELPLLADRYRLLERIGTGGVADVWHGIDERLDRDVAVKILHVDTDDEFRRRFTDEARRAAAISHPSVVTVYDAVADGEAFIVMELVRGQALDELARTRGPLHPREASRIVSQIAGALDAAHARGIVHCDVKPANVIVSDRGAAKLTDFGIARAAESAPERELVGTPRYVAPELVAGQPPTARSDVYSLGLVAYELIAGVPAYAEAGARELLRARLAQPPRNLRAARPGVSPSVDKVVGRALQRDPHRRYASAGEFAEAFAAALESDATTVLSHPARPARPAPLFDRRSALTLVVVLLIGGGLIAFLRGSVVPVVPDVRGMSYEQASSTLSQRGLSARREDRASTQRAGTVLDQSPAPGSQAHAGDPVTLAVAGAPKTPNVLGKKLNDAANALIQAGFAGRVNWAVDPSAHGEPQAVVRQEPAEGTTFTPGQSATVYIVGPGPGGEGKERAGTSKDDWERCGI